MSQCCDDKKPVAEKSCCRSKSGDSPYKKTSAEWSKDDSRGQIMCRVSDKFRSNYRVDPGLYALGNPGPDSPVLVSANYALSFNVLRRELKKLDCWILVIDTKGINVWCAAGKGTFGTKEIVNRIALTKLGTYVSHKSIIVPQLGAPGVSAHEVRKATGFSVKFGPVRARDLPAYLAAGCNATPEMRTAAFPLSDRLVLIPMELFPALRKYLWIVLGILAIMGLEPQGILFRPAMVNSWPVIIAGLLGIIAGSVIVPVLLPFIPFRSFAAKGAVTGAAMLAPLCLCFDELFMGDPFLAGAVGVFFTAVSSYLALNFTGCTTFTSISGVKREMKYAVPLYVGSCIVSAVLMVIFKFREWGML